MPQDGSESLSDVHVKTLLGGRLLFPLFSVLITLLPAFAQPDSNVIGFEDAADGQVPSGWAVARNDNAYRWETTPDCAGRPGRCLVVKGNTERPPVSGAWTSLMRSLDAAPYRGMRIRLRAWASVSGDGPAAQGRLWVRTDRPGGEPGLFDDMRDRPIRDSKWASYEIVGDVEQDAERLVFGAKFYAGGAARFDDFIIEMLGNPPRDPPRILTDVGLRNLTALARLYGVVRYFYPSAKVASLDWERFLIDTIPQVEGAKTERDLRGRLRGAFDSVIPGVCGGRLGSPGSGGSDKVIRWRHQGLGISPETKAVYSSELEIVAAAGATFPPYPAKISPGLTCQIPLALPAPVEVPRVTIPRISSKLHKTGIHRAARLAAVMIAWNIPQHFYPYFDVAGTDWAKELTRALRAAAATEGDESMIGNLRLLVAALRDGHGSVQGPGGQIFSVPIALAKVGEDFVVTEVGDAQGWPIRRGDAVTKVDGKPIADWYRAVAAQVSGATEQWIRGQALRLLLVGPKGTPCTLEVEPIGPDGERSRTVVMRRTGFAPREPRPGRTKELEPGIWYVNLDGIKQAEWMAALPSLAKATGIVFDMRGYPGMGADFLGHLSTVQLESAQWHTPIIKAPDQTAVEWVRKGEWALAPRLPYLGAKRVFLQNGATISYAESIMGIVEAYQVGDIVGETSAGTNGNVNPFEVPGGYTVWWTGMKVLKHDGSRHHSVGIHPTTVVRRTRVAIAAGRDEFIEQAVALLKAHP